MGTLLAWLLKPSNLIIVILAVLLALTWFIADVRKHKILGMEKDLAVCNGTVAEQKEDILTLNSIIEAMKANLAAIKKQAQEWQRIASEASELRRKIIELQNSPKECEVLQNEYRQVASDIVVYFNGGVRGKVKHPDTAGDRTAGEVLPGAGAADPAGPRNDAPASR